MRISDWSSDVCSSDLRLEDGDSGKTIRLCHIGHVTSTRERNVDPLQFRRHIPRGARLVHELVREQSRYVDVAVTTANDICLPTNRSKEALPIERTHARIRLAPVVGLAATQNQPLRQVVAAHAQRRLRIGSATL